MSESSIYNEKLLLEQVRSGNKNAFTTLYRRYSEAMYINVLKLVKNETIAEDIVQDIFARVWKKRETIQIDQSFKGYLYRIGQNLVFDHYRKLQRDQRLLYHFKKVSTGSYTHIE